MWVLAAGILGLVVGWLMTILYFADVLDRYPDEVRMNEKLSAKYSNCVALLESEIKKRMDLESRHSQLSQILNGVPLNEVQ